MNPAWSFLGNMIPLLMLISMFTASQARNMENINQILSLTKLFKFSPQRECLDECVTPLVIALYDMTAFGNSRTQFADVCGEYSSTMQCFGNQGDRCKDEAQLVQLLGSGIDVACDSQRSEFDKAFGCIDIFKDRPLAKCERSCRMYRSLFMWTSSRYMENLIAGNESLIMSMKNAGPFCSGLSCYLKCAQETLRRMCGPGGERILELVTRPLQKLSKLYKTSSVQLRMLLKRTAIPQQCVTFTENDDEESLEFDDGILRDLQIADLYDDEKKKKRQNSDYFDLSLVNIADKDVQQNGLFREKEASESQSTAFVVFTMVFVIMVLLVTVIGLGVAITWCVVSSRRTSKKMHDFLNLFAMKSPQAGVVERGVKSPSRSAMSPPKRAD